MTQHLCIAFEGTRRIAAGTLSEVARKAKAVLDRGEKAAVLIFDTSNGRPVEVDFRGSVADVLAHLSQPPEEDGPRGPGRPKLGVVAREVTLLPRHWEWLSGQPGGASVALRKLVEDARRANADKDRAREARDGAYRFMSAMAGNEPGFEEAARALFAGDRDRFHAESRKWPKDVRDQARAMAENSWTEG